MSFKMYRTVFIICFFCLISQSLAWNKTKSPSKSPGNGNRYGGPLIQKESIKALQYVGITYSVSRNTVLSADRKNVTLFKYCVEDGITYSQYIKELEGDAITAAFLVYDKNNTMAVVTNRNVYQLHWENDETYTIEKTVTFANNSQKSTSAVLDKNGQLFVLLTNANRTKGELIRLDNDQRVSIDTNLIKPSSATFNQYFDCFYLVDNGANTVIKYKYDENSKEMTDPKVILKFDDFKDRVKGRLSVITKDKGNNLYIGLNGTSAIMVYEEKLQKIVTFIPTTCPCPSSLKFVGPTYQTLALGTVKLSKPTSFPGCGNLYFIYGLRTQGRWHEAPYNPLNKKIKPL